MSNNRITLKDIALKASVHPTTVSMALRNHPELPEATRVRLQGLAKEIEDFLDVREKLATQHSKIN